MSQVTEHRNQEATCYVGNLDEKVTEELLWELCLQVGAVVNVHMPKDKVTGFMQGYAFVEFRTEEDADYTVKIMNMIKLYGKPIRVNKSSQDKRRIEVGANLFIGNLAPEVDEKLLYDTFSAFGGITQPPKVMRDLDTGNSKGFGFINFDSFEAADLAIEAMNQQFFCNRPIVVQYAYNKMAPGERHGSAAERLLAASANPVKLRPHTLFATKQGAATSVAPTAPSGAGGGAGAGMPGYMAGMMAGGMPMGMSAMAMPMGMPRPPMMMGGGMMMPPPPMMGMMGQRGMMPPGMPQPPPPPPPNMPPPPTGMPAPPTSMPPPPTGMPAPPTSMPPPPPPPPPQQ